MAGYIPAPSAPALIVEGRPDEVVELGRQPTELVPGNSVFLAPNAGERQVTISGVAGEPATALHHYRHAPLVGGGELVRKWTTVRMVQEAVATLAEVHLGTPATDVASGYYALTIAGSVTGSTELLLNTEGKEFYTFPLQSPSNVWWKPVGSSSGRANLIRGWARGVTPASPHKVWGIRYEPKVTLAAGVRRRLGILDSEGNWIVWTDTDKGFSSSDSVSVVLPVPYEAKVGVGYYVGVWAVDGTPDNGNIVGGERNTGTGGDATVLSSSTQAGPNSDSLAIDKYAPAGTTLKDALANSRAGVTNPLGTTATHGGLSTSDIPATYALGKTAGLLLSGDISVTAAVKSGAPTVAPAQLNIRVDIS